MQGRDHDTLGCPCKQHRGRTQQGAGHKRGGEAWRRDHNGQRRSHPYIRLAQQQRQVVEHRRPAGQRRPWQRPGTCDAHSIITNRPWWSPCTAQHRPALRVSRKAIRCATWCTLCANTAAHPSRSHTHTLHLRYPFRSTTKVGPPSPQSGAWSTAS